MTPVTDIVVVLDELVARKDFAFAECSMAEEVIAALERAAIEVRELREAIHRVMDAPNDDAIADMMPDLLRLSRGG